MQPAPHPHRSHTPYGPGALNSFLLLGAAAIALHACTREPSSTPPAAPAPPAETETAAQATNEADIVTAQRMLDYLENLVQRREFETARRAATELESRPLTPAQRQRLQQLKARIPAG
jgi:hypothetical protein